MTETIVAYDTLDEMLIEPTRRQLSVSIDALTSHTEVCESMDTVLGVIEILEGIQHELDTRSKQTMRTQLSVASDALRNHELLDKEATPDTSDTACGVADILEDIAYKIRFGPYIRAPR